MDGLEYEPLGHNRSSRRKVAILAISIVSLALVLATFLVVVYHVAKQSNSNNDNNNSSSSNSDLPTTWKDLSSTIQGMMDTSANPCDDFYQYACGNFIRNAVLPPGVDMYTPVFNEIGDNNMALLQRIIERQQWPHVGDLYSSCVNSTADQGLGPQIQQVFQQILSLNTNDDGTALMTLLANQHMLGSKAFFTVGASQYILEDNGLYYLLFDQGGITIGNPNAYENPSNTNQLMLLVSTLLSLNTNLTTSQATAAGRAVVKIEKQLAENFVNIQSFGDYQSNVTFTSLLSTGLKYDVYVTALGQARPSIVLLSGKDFFTSLNTVVQNSTQTELQYYLLWQFVLSLYLNQVPLKMPNLENDIELGYESVLSKMAKNGPQTRMVELGQSSGREAMCMQSVMTLMNDFVGHIFSTDIVDDSVRSDIKVMTGGIQNAFQGGLGQVSWLDDAGRAAATFKLNNIIQLIGHPSVLNRYKGLVLSETDFGYNTITLSANTMKFKLSVVGTPYNRAGFEFDATVVNAFYSPLSNTINFPAGILRNPMYNSSYPRLAIFARMGYVVGHEITHGFDNNGHHFDAYGAYINIFDPQTEANFDQQASCLVSQYGQFEVIPGVYINGNQTLGENIADLGGVKNSYRAYQAWLQANGDEFQGAKLVPFLSNKQAFWVHLAQTWCSIATDEALAQQVATDAHSPAKFRVNGPLSNFDQFSTDFQCAAGTNMNRANKCGIW